MAVLVMVLSLNHGSCQENEPVWGIVFDADFNALDLSTGKLIGTYTITFHEWFADNTTTPTGRYWSSSKFFGDFGFEFLNETTPEGDFHRFRSFRTIVEDELNLTEFPMWFPFDYYVTGIVVALNVTMDFGEVLVSIDLSSELQGSWIVSYTFDKIDPDSPEVPFLSMLREDLSNIGWESISAYSLTFHFHRQQAVVNRFALIFFAPIILLVAVVLCWLISLTTKKQHPTIFTGIASLHVPFIALLFSISPPPVTFAFLSLVSGFAISLFSAVAQFLIQSRQKSDMEKKIDEIHSFIGKGIVVQTSIESPLQSEHVDIDVGDSILIADTERGKDYCGTVVDTNLSVKVSYEEGKEGFFENQVLVRLSQPIPRRVMIAKNDEGFPIGVVWAASNTHAIAAKIPGEKLEDVNSQHNEN